MPLTVCIFTPEVPSSLRSHGATIIAIAQNFAGRGELGARAADEIRSISGQERTGLKSIHSAPGEYRGTRVAVLDLHALRYPGIATTMRVGNTRSLGHSLSSL